MMKILKSFIARLIYPLLALAVIIFSLTSENSPAFAPVSASCLQTTESAN